MEQINNRWNKCRPKINCIRDSPPRKSSWTWQRRRQSHLEDRSSYQVRKEICLPTYWTNLVKLLIKMWPNKNTKKRRANYQEGISTCNQANWICRSFRWTRPTSSWCRTFWRCLWWTSWASSLQSIASISIHPQVFHIQPFLATILPRFPDRTI